MPDEAGLAPGVASVRPVPAATGKRTAAVVAPPGAPRPPAVTVDALAKTFRIPHQQANTLKERVLHPARTRARTDFRALRDVSFAIPEGEFFGIVGRNGSGKSTLLKCLAGIYEPDEGGVSVRGRLATFIELGVGFNPELTARDNVIINATMLGLTRREAAERFDEIIAFAELEEFVDLKLKNYSSGMNVRLAFSTAVQVDADVLLVDEVLAVGDAAFQLKCQEQFRRLKDEGRTILFVTHDMGAVERFCDRAMLLERGEVVDIGDPRAIGRAYHELNFGRQSTTRADEERYGAHDAAEVVRVWFEQPGGQLTQSLLSGEPAVVGFEVWVREDVLGASLSVTLRDEAHRPVFRASSDWDPDFPRDLAGGERYGVRLHFDCLLAPGRYSATPAISRGGRAEDIIDPREGTGSVVVHSVRESGGVVDLPHRFGIDLL